MEDFSAVAIQFKPMIHQIMSRLSIYKNKDDFFQIGLIALWEAYKKFDSNQGEFLNYAYMTVKGRMINELKRQRIRELPSISLEYVNIQDKGMLDCYESLQHEHMIMYTKNLTENQKKWLILTFIEQKTLTEIASTYNVTVSAVKSWRSSALRKLRSHSDFLGCGHNVDNSVDK